MEVIERAVKPAANKKRRETLRLSRRLADGIYAPSRVLLRENEFTHPYWLSICISIEIQTVIYH